jgi:hypothetical protein
MGFQTVVNQDPAPAVKGDFAGANPHAAVLAPEGGFKAAGSPRFPIVGNFAWGNLADGLVGCNFLGLTTEVLGFLRRDQMALLLDYFAGDTTMRLYPGAAVTIYSQGAFWAEFPAGATVGEKVFANYLDGSVYAAAAGTTTVSATFTGVIAVTTGILTSSAVTGTIQVGDVLSGTGVPAGTRILAQISGTPGGAGTYQTSIVTAVASTAMTARDSVETDFTVDTPALAGELAQITNW